jgi:hypothetical protein
MPIGVASSILKDRGFDLRETVRVAEENSAGAVQLYVNKKAKEDSEYARRLTAALAETDMTIIVHLPNKDKLDETDIAFAEKLEQNLRGKDVRTLIHYEEGMRVEDVPLVNGYPVGIENSKTGVFDAGHVKDAFLLARMAGSFFVFDHGRIMYADENSPPGKIITFIKKMISALNPGIDIIHTGDKTNWYDSFGKAQCAFGDENGIAMPLLPDLQDFSRKGGVVIIETEDEEMGLRALERLQR